MHSSDINEILKRINELRALFILGQRAVPFLEEVFVFLREIAPLLDEINQSIRESAASMPRATSQLKSASDATKLATTEILDLVDGVFDQLTPLKQHLDHTGSALARIAAIDIETRRIAEISFAEKGVDIPQELKQLWIERQNLLEELQAECSEEQEGVEEIRACVSRIMMSLQVQDITEQQIASSNHLIESIRRRMNDLVERLGVAPPPPPETEWPELGPVTFDPNARYDHDRMRQSSVDEVIRRQASTSVSSAHPSANEAPITDALIDQLFSSCDAEPPRPSEAGEEPADTSNGESPASQSEIDALFQSGSNI